MSSSNAVTSLFRLIYSFAILLILEEWLSNNVLFICVFLQQQLAVSCVIS